MDNCNMSVSQKLLLEDRPEKGHGELRVQFGCDRRQAKQAAQVAQSSVGGAQQVKG